MPLQGGPLNVSGIHLLASATSFIFSFCCIFCLEFTRMLLLFLHDFIPYVFLYIWLQKSIDSLMLCYSNNYFYFWLQKLLPPFPNYRHFLFSPTHNWIHFYFRSVKWYDVPNLPLISYHHIQHHTTTTKFFSKYQGNRGIYRGLLQNPIESTYAV